VIILLFVVIQVVGWCVLLLLLTGTLWHLIQEMCCGLFGFFCLLLFNFATKKFVFFLSFRKLFTRFSKFFWMKNCFTEPWLWDFGLAFWRAALFDSIQPNDDNVRRQPERNWMKLAVGSWADVRRPTEQSGMQQLPSAAATSAAHPHRCRARRAERIWTPKRYSTPLSRVDLFQVGISDFVFRIHFGLLRGDDARALK